MSIIQINGGVTAAGGFTASGTHCGIRKNRAKSDLALIFCENRASAACVYTQNLVKGAPLQVTKSNVSDGYAQAIVCNSGNANTCNANGMEIAESTCALVGEALGISKYDVVVASTGVIGQPLDITPIKNGIPKLACSLSADGSIQAAEAIMTTDTRVKELAFEFTVGGKSCRIGGIAKGSGMIHPNMATMLVFITTDAAITPEMLKRALKNDVDDSFNMISIDGDTSTNDMVCVLAGGGAGNPEISEENDDYKVFCEALAAVTKGLCRMIAADGEGATRLIDCVVTGAKSVSDAKKAAKSVVCSSLFKAAVFGADANWGRVLCAIGYSGADCDVTKVALDFASAAGVIRVCEDGAGVPFSEETAKKILSEPEIEVRVYFADGDCRAEAWGCDLTYDYVEINGDYRT